MTTLATTTETPNVSIHQQAALEYYFELYLLRLRTHRPPNIRPRVHDALLAKGLVDRGPGMLYSITRLGRRAYAKSQPRRHAARCAVFRGAEAVAAAVTSFAPGWHRYLGHDSGYCAVSDGDRAVLLRDCPRFGAMWSNDGGRTWYGWKALLSLWGLR